LSLDFRNAVILKTGLGVRQGHWNRHGSIRQMSWPWNQGQRSLKVIGTDTYRSAAYDFLL